MRSPRRDTRRRPGLADLRPSGYAADGLHRGAPLASVAAMQEERICAMAHRPRRRRGSAPTPTSSRQYLHRDPGDCATVPECQESTDTLGAGGVAGRRRCCPLASPATGQRCSADRRRPRQAVLPRADPGRCSGASSRPGPRTDLPVTLGVTLRLNVDRVIFLPSPSLTGSIAGAAGAPRDVTGDSASGRRKRRCRAGRLRQIRYARRNLPEAGRGSAWSQHSRRLSWCRPGCSPPSEPNSCSGRRLEIPGGRWSQGSRQGGRRPAGIAGTRRRPCAGNGRGRADPRGKVAARGEIPNAGLARRGGDRLPAPLEDHEQLCWLSPGRLERQLAPATPSSEAALALLWPALGG